MVALVPVRYLLVGIWHLTESFNSHNTHKRVIAKLYSFTLRSKITDKQQHIRNFVWHRELMAHLPNSWNVLAKPWLRVPRRLRTMLALPPHDSKDAHFYIETLKQVIKTPGIIFVQYFINDVIKISDITAPDIFDFVFFLLVFQCHVKFD